MSEKEPGAINREPGNHLAIALQMPEEFRTERGFVEINGSVPIVHCQHDGDLSSHHFSQQCGKVQEKSKDEMLR
jgi:hypothetical protein